MRLIGEIPRELDPQVLEDHLLGLGVKSRIDRRPDGWAVWIINEDHVERARQELQDFLAAPEDPRFRVTASRAREVRKQEARKEREYRKNNRDAGDVWGPPTFRRRPVTVLTVVIAAIVFILQHSSYAVQTVMTLSYFDLGAGPQIFREHRGLTDILNGQVWRTISPIFLHFGPWHILFNAMWIMTLGTIIETKRGSWKLLAIILATAVLSNYAQYAYVEHFQEARLGPGRGYTFGGLSGVNFALFGYIWMMGENYPEEGLAMDPRTTVLMLAWLVICFTGLVGPVANAAHVGGLVVGMTLGLLKF